MKLLWSCDLTSCEQPFWDPSCTYGGVFQITQTEIRYYHYSGVENTDHLKVTTLSHDGEIIETNLYPLPKEHLLPYLWKYTLIENRPAILLSDHAYFDINEKVIIDKPTPALTKAYTDFYLDNPYHLTDDTFSFPPYEISHVGSFGYLCQKDGHEIWRYKGQGYLYTEIEKYDQYIVFGTAGHGGRFVCIELASGNVVFELNTKGTTDHAIINDRFYTYFQNKKGYLAELSLDGKTEFLELPGVVIPNCPISAYKDKILTISFIKKKDEYLNPVLNFVQI